ncbi:hypothetical protein RHMOL_Rhmol03G0114800 [Rhododendron molle]|uniref:Uncharacterized protein n=1 Tax=Rhododendron molle TaxID=49168 RepID=A0ACC0PCR0_RHOML|nr:hypothetical protein RHMOL_Rhmol03G0114800 [Rhododendron molle]
MGEKDIVTWNSILAGCAQNGFGDAAIKVEKLPKAQKHLGASLLVLMFLYMVEISNCICCT